MRHDAAKTMTYYIISAPESENCITSLKNIPSLVCNDSAGSKLRSALMQHPLELPVRFSKILCESSQRSIHLFRQSMLAQVPILPRLICQH